MSAAGSIPSVVRSYQGNPYRVGRWTDDELVHERLFLDTELSNLDAECEYPERLESTRAYLLAVRQMVIDELQRRQRTRLLPKASTDLKPYWEAIKAQVTVVDLWEKHFPLQPLRQTGRGWRGACPLCGERDPETCARPAFSVFDDGRAWYCFRCLEGGDIFTLARWLFNDRSFPAVADAIAADFGIAKPNVKQNTHDCETHMIPSRQFPRGFAGRNHSRESKRPGFEIRGGKVVPS